MKKSVMSILMLIGLGVGIGTAGCAAGNQERLDASSTSLAMVEGFADVHLATISEVQKNSLKAHLSVVLGEKVELPLLITKLSDLDQKAALSIVWNASSGKVPSPCVARLVVLASPGKVLSDTTFGCAGHHGWIIAISREVPSELQRSALTIKSETLGHKVILYIALIKGKPALIRLQEGKGVFQNWYDSQGAATFGYSEIGVDSVDGASEILRHGELSAQLALLVALAGHYDNPEAPARVVGRSKPVQEILQALESSTNVWVREQSRFCLESIRSQ